MGGGTMHLLFDIGYRIVAIAFCFSSGRAAWHGLVERKIILFDTDILDWWSPSTQVFLRDVAPVRYWMVVSMEAGAAVLCFVAAIVGWWQPNT